MIVSGLTCITTKRSHTSLQPTRRYYSLGRGAHAIAEPGMARGLSGQGLADECLKQLNGGKLPGFSATLTEAAEFYAAWYSRKELDQFVKRRLEHLQPTLGHFILASLPWRAVVTTNYNRVIEDAWGAAHGAGFARR